MPPEQWAIILAASIGLVGTAIASVRYFIRWQVQHFTQLQDMKLETMRQSLENDRKELDAKIRKQEMDTQVRLDETQNSRESMRFLMSELAEQRKEDAEQRKFYERRDESNIKALQHIAENGASVDRNTAAVLELLKARQSFDDNMALNQERIMEQNNRTHSKLSELDLDIVKLTKSVNEAVGHLNELTAAKASDTETLASIQKLLLAIQDSIQSISQKLSDSIARSKDTPPQS